MNIIIVCGGKSVEEQISIITAIKVYKSLLSSADYHPYLVYQDPNDFNFYGGQGPLSLDNYADKKRFSKAYFKRNKNKYFLKVKSKKIYFDLILPIVHGAGAEDGTMAAYFITQGFPTLTPPISASALCQDKIILKDLLKQLKIKSTRAKYLSLNEFTNNLTDISEFIKSLKFPLIVKPYDLGSSIGISVATSSSELIKSLNDAFKYSDYAIIEEYIEDCEEVNIALIKDEKNQYHFSDLEKITPNHNSIYTYEDKYIHSGVKKVFPYKPEEKELKEIQDICIKLYDRLKLAGPVRYDFIKKNDQIYLNEVNTIPGNFASHLFLSKGYTIKALVDIYIKSCEERIKKINQPLPAKTSIESLSESNKLKLL